MAVTSRIYERIVVIYERIVVNRILHCYLATYRRPVFVGAVFTNAQASIRGAAAISW